jgi:branched-chain amino acid transport system ATP-binding protein|tara:strand:+ start:14624 stop:15331 length:708 start_codon:yes stop_codon:yes gene_type:complete
MLEINSLKVAYGPIVALQGVTLTVAKGEVVTVIGSNGAGKSTLLKTLAGILAPREGEIRFEGLTVAGSSSAKMVKCGVALVPEGRHVFPQLTVRENLTLGAYYRRDHAGVREDMEHTFELFPILRERISQHGGSLSGGQQQMLAIGRALMSRPRLLMLDEPSLGLAPAIVQQIGRLIADLNRTGTTILLVEQNARMALRLADRAYVMANGRIVEQGTGAELLNNPTVQESYLGGG